MTEAIRIEKLRKSYGSVEVLKGVDLEFAPGEVHALLGANGAGKSTLLGCLSGAVLPTSGRIFVGEREHSGFSPRDAFDAGTAIIYQHFQLAESLTVSDNIFLGAERKTRTGLLRKKEQRRIAREVLSRVGLDIEPTAIVETLSTGEQQGVEIARAMRREPRLLILDEPTAALGKHEVAALLDLVRRLAHDHGIAVVFVTHLLGEVMEVADRVSILRGGQVLWTRSRADVQVDDMVEGISPQAETVHTTKERRPSGREHVKFEDFTTSYCGPLDLSLGEGEIVGVFGILGSGRSNLLETIAGARAPWRGGFSIGGRDVRPGPTARLLESGVALVASDRAAQSLFASMTAQENLLMPHYSEISRVRRSSSKEARVFADTAREVALTPADPTALGSSFSGGNAQKLVVGRWLANQRNIELLLLDEPTQGVDIGSRAQIYDLLRDFAVQRQGRSVMFATSDPDEAVLLADRIVVLVDGRVADVVDPSAGEAKLLGLAQSVETKHGISRDERTWS